MRPRGALAAGLAVCLASLGGCGDDGEQVHNAERVARCITGRSGTLLTDPFIRDFRLSAALRRQARSAARVGEGSTLPRPTSFAAFVGSDATFVPRDFDGSGFVPAAFVFFDTPAAAQAHRDDADLARGNMLVVFDGDAPEAQREFIDGCL